MTRDTQGIRRREARPEERRGATRPRRWLTLASLALLALAAPRARARAQDGYFPVGANERHGENLRLERRLAWMDEWFTASSEARADALGIWKVMLGRGSQAAASPTSVLVGRLIRVLVHGETAARAGRSEFVVADNIDLRVVPGVFASRSEGIGEALVVNVKPLDKLTDEPGMPESVDLCLVWVGPAGQELVARSEPIGRKAFVLDGFEMYVRPPISAPGFWRLVPEVRVGAHVARGLGVPVECVERLQERYAAFQARQREKGSTDAYEGALIERVEHGVRDLTLPSVDALLDGRTGELRNQMVARAKPHANANWTTRGADAWVLDPPDSAHAPAELLVSICSPRETPAWLFAGEAGRLWQEYGEQVSARIVSLDFEAAGQPGLLWELLASERAAHPDARLCLVARASSLFGLGFELQDEGKSALIDRLVYISPIVREHAPSMHVRMPWLFLEPLGEEYTDQEIAVEEGADGYWARRPEPIPIAELELPGLLRRVFE